MTAKEFKKILKQYKLTKSEIKEIKEKMKKLPATIKVTDTVKSSSDSHPYTEYPATIKGYIINPKVSTYQKRLEKLVIKKTCVDLFLQSLHECDDLELSQSIKLYYIEKKGNWEDISKELGDERSGECYRKAANTYIQEYIKNI